MTARRRNTARVVLGAAFLGLAAGGTAACDSADDDHTFYCVDQNDTIVNEDDCDDDGNGAGGFFLLGPLAALPRASSPAPSCRRRLEVRLQRHRAAQRVGPAGDRAGQQRHGEVERGRQAAASGSSSKSSGG